MKPRPVTILPDLIERTKVAAHELDNAVARRFERMLITVAGGDASMTESTLSLSVIDGLIVVSRLGHFYLVCIVLCLLTEIVLHQNQNWTVVVAQLAALFIY